MVTSLNESLRDDILAELDFDPRVDARTIGVAVQDGIVTLTGRVRSLPEKWAVEDAVGRVEGVRGVAEALVVDLPEFPQRTDADVARAAADALAWDSIVPESVMVTVHQGHATLRGDVAWNYQREEAEHVIRRLSGIRSVTNVITLQNAAVQPSIENEIRRALRRYGFSDAIHVGVDSRGSVTLKGRVRTWGDRGKAWQAVWSVPGVRVVDNRLEVY